MYEAAPIQLAVAVIRNSSVPLEAVAEACGDDSASHLRRHVKRATGRSPGAPREHERWSQPRAARRADWRQILDRLQPPGRLRAVVHVVTTGIAPVESWVELEGPPGAERRA